MHVLIIFFRGGGMQYRIICFRLETRKRREIITICDDMGNQMLTVEILKELLRISKMQLKIVASCGFCSFLKRVSACCAGTSD